MCINKECPVVNQELGLCMECAWDQLEDANIPYELIPKIIQVIYKKDTE